MKSKTILGKEVTIKKYTQAKYLNKFIGKVSQTKQAKIFPSHFSFFIIT